MSDTDTLIDTQADASKPWTLGGSQPLATIREGEYPPTPSEAQERALAALRARLGDNRKLQVRWHRSWGVTLAVVDTHNVTEFRSYEGRDLDAAIALAQAGRGL